jgi:hypothetical protein
MLRSLTKSQPADEADKPVADRLVLTEVNTVVGEVALSWTMSAIRREALSSKLQRNELTFRERMPRLRKTSGCLRFDFAFLVRRACRSVTNRLLFRERLPQLRRTNGCLRFEFAALGAVGSGFDTDGVDQAGEAAPNGCAAWPQPLQSSHSRYAPIWRPSITNLPVAKERH